MSVLLERLAKHGSVPLEGYGHQVGGHYLLMKFEDTICKPLIRREHFFYETLPEDLKLFLPTYYGVIKVAFERQSSGDIQMVAYPDNHKTSSASQTTKIESCSLKASTGRSIHVGGETSITSKGVAGGDSYVNPWSEECTKNTTRKLEQFGSQLEDMHQDYVVLENLTSKFSSPSILDLKVGTRQHGDDVSEEKKKRHMKTVATSTSSSLGVRICGMQKFDASKNEYIFRDKYYGRSLDNEGFYQELRAFLHNGVCFRLDLVPSLLSMVKELRRIIRRQGSYRFYSSSLLIIYDGAVTPEFASNERQGISRELKPTTGQENCQSRDSRLDRRRERETKTEHDSTVADDKGENVLPREAAAFPSAKAMTQAQHSHPQGTVSDSSETLTGLSSATELARHSDSSPSQHSAATVTQEPLLPLPDEEARLHTPNKVRNGYHHRNHHVHCDDAGGKMDLEMARKSVDLRMIDFAHSTHSGYNDEVQYCGPDDGYVTGVSSLVNCLEQMLEST